MKRGAGIVLVLFLVLVLAGGGRPAQAKKSSSSFSSGGKSSSTTSSGKSSGWSNSTSQPKAAPASSSPPAASGWSNTTSKPAATPEPAKPASASGWSGSAPQTATPGTTPAPPPGTPAKPATGGTWSNTSGASAPSGAETGRPKSTFATAGQSAIQKEASLKAYNDYKGKFAKPDNPVGAAATSAPTPTRTWDNYRDYQTNRDNYYAGRNWSPPGYAYQSFPSFGLWDALFLWFMLRQATGPSFMYHHQDDPGVKSFRQEADKLAASNADLKKQLADLDAKVEQMKKEGVPADPKYMPQGVDASVALAAEKVVKEPPAAKSSGVGTWLWIVGAGLGVAAVFLLLTRNRGRNTRS
jgi:hypothetical protein